MRPLLSRGLQAAISTALTFLFAAGCSPGSRIGRMNPDGGSMDGNGSGGGGSGGNGGQGGSAGAGGSGGSGGTGGAGGSGGAGGGGAGAGGFGGGGAGGSGGAGGMPEPGSCAEAEKKKSEVGCLFYGYDIDNSNMDDVRVFGFAVGVPGTAPGSVTVERKTAPGSWEMMVSAMVMPGKVDYFPIFSHLDPGIIKYPYGKDYHIEGTGLEPKAYRIKSDKPIVVYQINSDDDAGWSFSSGSTLVLPVSALGGHYYALAMTTAGSEDRGFVAVVGTRDGTKVQVRVSADTTAGGSVPALAKGATWDTMLNEGDVLQVEGRTGGEDISGTEITADQPVTVFSGNVCTAASPAGMMRNSPCDHIEEQMYPVTAWGKIFVVLDMRLPEKEMSVSNVWAKVVASQDGTSVIFEAPTALPGLPPVTTLNAGGVLPVTINRSGMAQTAWSHYLVTADKPIQIASFMGLEEGGAVVIPVEQFQSSYLLSAHPWFDPYLLVTRKAGTPVKLDGTVMPDSVFTPVTGGFEVGRVHLMGCLPAPGGGACNLAHRVEGMNIGVTITANGGSCNYCYAGGAGTRCVNKGGATAGDMIVCGD